jgi:hypothetical protein
MLGALLLAALAVGACKVGSKSEVSGTVALDGAPFSVKHCTVYEVKASGDPNPGTSRMVTLHATNSPVTLSISEATPSARVTLLVDGKVLEVGERCASLTISGAPLSDPAGVTGSAKIACTGAGHQVAADFTFAKCSDSS